MSNPPTIQASPHILSLLQKLHTISTDQEAELRQNGGYAQLRAASAPDATASTRTTFNTTFQDKFIALEPDKSAFVYNLLRANGALNVVEAGTSFGVSTIYLALAVGQNAQARGLKAGDAKVIATENEPTKAVQARAYWDECGDEVKAWVELREGDLRETLKESVPTLDTVLFDIWTPMALPTLKVLEPRFRPGTVLVVDNVESSKEGYAAFYEYITSGPYTAVTLPYTGGLGVVVYQGA